MILHRESGTTQQQWEDDAKKKLQGKFEGVARKCDGVQAEERVASKNGNLDALKEWGAGDEGLLAENVQLLASVVEEVMALVEPDGRIQRILGVFEEWIEWVSGVWDDRQSLSSEKIEFVEGLGEKWRAECKALLRRLGALGRVLDGLERAKEGSSLYFIIEGVGILRNGAIEEMKSVLKLEEGVVEQERAWVDERVGRLERVIGFG
jgi:hypothetical protein